MPTAETEIESLANREYRWGFVTDVEADSAPPGLNEEIVRVLKRLMRVQETLLKVNANYISSAATDDRFRTEPPFKLQGSYRNMNKMSEKIVAVMNDDELDRLVDDHYRGESQTLTTGAEHNLLKLAELRGGGTIADQVTAQSAVDSAQTARASALENLRVLMSGGTLSDRAAAVAAVESAQAAYRAARTRYEQARIGPDSGRSLTAQQLVVDAQNQLNAAQQKAAGSAMRV